MFGWCYRLSFKAIYVSFVTCLCKSLCIDSSELLLRALAPVRWKQEVQTTHKHRSNRFLSEAFCEAWPIKKQQCCWSDGEIRKTIAFIFCPLNTVQQKMLANMFKDRYLYVKDTYSRAPTRCAHGCRPTNISSKYISTVIFLSMPTCSNITLMYSLGSDLPWPWTQCALL